MTGVIDEETCPQCGNPHAYNEFQTRTYEEVLFCMRCGYRSWTRTLIDRKRSAVDPEGRKFFLRRKDGALVQRLFERKGHGACCLRSPDGFGSLLGFDKPLARAHQAKITAAIQSGKWGDIELDPQGSYLTAWDEGAIQVQVLAGVLPPELSEG